MSDSPIHDLPAASSVAATDVVPIDQGLVTRKATMQQVSQAVGPINVGVGIHGANFKTTPIDPDELGLVDTADGNTLKKLTWGNLKATLLAYFSVLTGTWNISTTGNSGSATKLQTARNLDVTSFDGTTDVKVVAPAIHAAPNKTAPVDTDEAGIWDNVSGLLNKVTWANIKTTLAGTFTTIVSVAASGGSALIGFLQIGTGAVGRTVQDKLRESVSVRDYGATGDGITDDTLAIQAAINASSSIFFPSGNYIVSTALNISSFTGGKFLYGVKGLIASRIQWQGNTIGPVIDGSGSIFLQIRDLRIETTITYPVEVGMLFSRTSAASSDLHRIDNVRVYGYFTKAAVYELTSERNNHTNCYYETLSAGGYAYAREGTNSLVVTSPYNTLVAYDGNTAGILVGCSIYNTSGGIAVLLNGVSDFNIIGGDMKVTTGDTCISFKGGANGVNILGVRMEGVSNPHTIKFEDAGTYQDVNILGGEIDSFGTGFSTAAIYGVNGATLTNSSIKGVGYSGSSYAISLDQELRCEIQTPLNHEIRTSAYHNKIWAGTQASLSLPANHAGNLITYTQGGTELNNGLMYYDNDAQFDGWARITALGSPVSWNMNWNNKYNSNGFAGAFTVATSGNFTAYSAPSGSAGATVTLTPVFTINNDGAIKVLNSLAIPAGGTLGKGVMVSSTANFGIFFGSGVPTLVAAKGSIYLRSDGTTTNDRMYVNTDGSFNWTAVTTAA